MNCSAVDMLPMLTHHYVSSVHVCSRQGFPYVLINSHVYLQCFHEACGKNNSPVLTVDLL